jgi:DNA-3-methyladenine glycosylase I
MMSTYHDLEWGTPSHDDRYLFELMVLESSQSGLSWRTVLNKRDGYRRLFRDFDATAVATFDDGDVERLVADPSIIRHRGKIESAIENARRIVALRDETGSLDGYVWSFTGGETVKNRWRTMVEVPAQSALSVTVARDLRRRGFRFLGPTTVYSYLQAVGVVNDHLVTCPRW